MKHAPLSSIVQGIANDDEGNQQGLRRVARQSTGDGKQTMIIGLEIVAVVVLLLAILGFVGFTGDLGWRFPRQRDGGAD